MGTGELVPDDRRPDVPKLRPNGLLLQRSVPDLVGGTIAMGHVCGLAAGARWAAPLPPAVVLRMMGQKPLARQEAGAGLSAWRGLVPGWDASWPAVQRSATEQWRLRLHPVADCSAARRPVDGKPAPGGDVRSGRRQRG